MYCLLTLYSYVFLLVHRFNVQNLNKQCRLYQQGLTPITKTVPGRGGWERLRDRVQYEVNSHIYKGQRLHDHFSDLLYIGGPYQNRQN